MLSFARRLEVGHAFLEDQLVGEEAAKQTACVAREPEQEKDGWLRCPVANVAGQGHSRDRPLADLRRPFMYSWGSRATSQISTTKRPSTRDT
jgi:hypothetical protein